MKKLLLASVLFVLASTAQHQTTFTNPLLASGPDPWVLLHDGTYYYMSTTASNLTIWKTNDITDLKDAKKKVVWRPPSEGPYSHDIWAPELHFLRGKWFIYFAADAGTNVTHRIFVLENDAADPLEGSWMMKGKVSDASDKWAIDASVFENKGQLYLIWSGWPGDQNGEQDIYIGRLKNPWTVVGPRVKISSPQYPWEKVGDTVNGKPTHIDVNEGPEILKHGNNIFLTYSASACWSDQYALGLLRASENSDLMDAASWEKSPQPVLSELPGAHAFGTGHNGFFKSPDGKEDWIIYHANPETHQGCGAQRSPRAQQFIWDRNGWPDFGTPAPLGKPMEKPSH